MTLLWLFDRCREPAVAAPATTARGPVNAPPRNAAQFITRNVELNITRAPSWGLSEWA